MFKYSDIDYDCFYSSDHCKKENTEIKHILEETLDDCSCVVDIGAGTGLVASLIGMKHFVLQVEKDEGMREKNPYPSFIHSDALQFFKLLKKEPVCMEMFNKFKRKCVVSVFALNYMPIGTLTEAVKFSNSPCVFIVYNKPYLKGSGSIYCGHKLKFVLIHAIRKMILKIEIQLIKKTNDVCMFALLNEPYYKVVVVK